MNHKKKNNIQKLFINNIFFLVIINLGNFLNLISQFFLSRNLDFSNFSLYVACLNLLTIFTTINIVSPILIRNYFDVQNKINIKKIILLKKILIYYLIYWIITCLVLIGFKNYFLIILKINNTSIIFFLISSIATINLMSILYGIFLSINKYKQGALLNSLNPFLRFSLILIIFYFFSNTALDLIYTTLYASFMVVLISLVILFTEHKKILTKVFSVNIRDLKIPYFFEFFLYLLTFSLIFNIDNLVVRYLFSEKISAEYISMNLISKIIFFLVIGIAPLMFAELKKLKNQLPLYISIFIVIFLGTIFFLTINIFHKEISIIIFDNKYLDNTNIMIQLSLANIFFGILYFLILNKLAKKNYMNLIFMFISMIIYTYALFNIKSDLGGIANIVLTFSIIFVISMLLDFKLFNKILYKAK